MPKAHRIFSWFCFPYRFLKFMGCVPRLCQTAQPDLFVQFCGRLNSDFYNMTILGVDDAFLPALWAEKREVAQRGVRKQTRPRFCAAVWTQNPFFFSCIHFYLFRH